MPRAPKKCGRPDCEERVVARRYCPTHEAEQRDASTWGRGSSRQSRRTRARVLELWPVCYLQYEGCTQVSTEDEHVIPRSQGGSDDLANRRGACHHCHQAKTQREAAQGRARGRRRPVGGPGGHPLPRT